MVDWLARLAFDGFPFIATTLCEERIRGFGERAIAELRYFSKRECRINFLSLPLLFSHTVFAVRAVHSPQGVDGSRGRWRWSNLPKVQRKWVFPPSRVPFVFCFLRWLNDEGRFYSRRHALKLRRLNGALMERSDLIRLEGGNWIFKLALREFIYIQFHLDTHYLWKFHGLLKFEFAKMFINSSFLAERSFSIEIS